jgi:hypothetical protein
MYNPFTALLQLVDTCQHVIEATLVTLEKFNTFQSHVDTC